MVAPHLRKEGVCGILQNYSRRKHHPERDGVFFLLNFVEMGGSEPPCKQVLKMDLHSLVWLFRSGRNLIHILKVRRNRYIPSLYFSEGKRDVFSSIIRIYYNSSL